MASLTMNIPHELSQQEALSRIKGMLQKLKEEQKGMITNMKEDWKGETGSFEFTAKGFDVSGIITVQPSGVDVDAKLPFALSLFKGQIKQVIEQKAKELLAK